MTERLTPERDVVREIRAELPVEDLVAWVVGRYPDADFDEVGALLRQIYEAGFLVTPVSGPARRYEVGGRVLEAKPQRVAMAP